MGGRLTRTLGLPAPALLRRYRVGQPLLEGPALVGSAPGGRMQDVVVRIVNQGAGEVVTEPSESDRSRWAAVVFDATGIGEVGSLVQLPQFVGPAFRRLGRSGRLLVLGTPPESLDDPEAAAAQRALDGFVRSAAKEARGGATANLLYVAQGAEAGAESTLRFLLSARSAYVSGQPIRLKAGDPTPAPTPNWEEPLAERVAVVTGAARGIGAAIAEVLARDGAHVVCVDVPAAGAGLAEVANRLGGTAFQLDITAPDAPARLLDHLRQRHGGAHVVVHNAGITRDKTLANMTPDLWSSLMAVNLEAQLRINRALLEDDALHDAARVICVSSTSGIAGNRGQTNYAASKAGIIGMVEALAPSFALRGATINAVAPGFIETEMTAAMPFAVREMGRRVNSMGQGGLPVDVAETVAWLAQPGTAGVTGQTLRVCGQSLVGA
ncbi:MAG TPA: 3-oxoacyl-ACP reductase [Candidatus Dormibacteraeota bacterium]